MKRFEEKVYAAAKKIPRGKVSTYAALALAIGAPRAARAVGNALNKSPGLPNVPCHRVVRSDGSLGGYARGPTVKTKLLRGEGVLVEKGKVDLNRFGFRF
ncbi:MAG: MGMT family protein [Candidatus Brennerbacteria bacterium]|nr:MGMT family protein [Candidatus Brennerbacteria bacterium]